MLSPYLDDAPERAALDAGSGPLLLEFGSNACGYCHGAEPLVASALASHPVPHLRIQDGKGRRLGRSYGVKLWPTLIALRDGREVARVVRPASAAEVTAVLQALNGG
jgi:thioredoxin 1